MTSANRVQVVDIYTFTQNEFLNNDNMKKKKIPMKKGANNMLIEKKKGKGPNICLLAYVENIFSRV